jgi:hypothetical protein
MDLWNGQATFGQAKQSGLFWTAILAGLGLLSGGCGVAGHSAKEGTALAPGQIETWLQTNIPPLAEEIAASPIKLSAPELVANEFGQETLSVAYKRPVVVRTMAAELNLVLLPANGGQARVFAMPSTLIQPMDSGTIRGITSGLLDYRGKISHGIRAYLEMKQATMNMGAGEASRVSDVIWFGTQEQLAEAARKGPPPSVTPGAGPTTPTLQNVPTGEIPKGTPLSMRCGDRWARGFVAEASGGDRVKLLVYLVRRDKPYMPWTVELPRTELRIESDALADLQRNPAGFAEIAANNDMKLSRHGMPNKLVPVNPGSVKAGTAVLDFWNGMLDPCKATGPVQDGAVPIQRVGLDNAKMVKLAAGLFLDPFADSAGK